MSDIENFLFEINWQVLVSILTSILLAIPFSKWLSKRQKEIKDNRKKHYSEIVYSSAQIIRNGSVRGLFDLVDYIEGYENYNNLRIAFPRSYHKILASIKHIILKNKENQNSSIETLDKIKKELREIERKIALNEPFSNAPTKERNLLMDILELSQQKENKLFIDKLHKLSDLIVTREETITKIGSDNDKALRLTKRSIYLTIFFFIISAALTIYTII